MIKISLLKEGNWFKHKNSTYEIMSFDYVFTTAKKINNDGIKHYFLNSIQVEKMYKDHYQKNNPDYGITVVIKNVIVIVNVAIILIMI